MNTNEFEVAKKEFETAMEVSAKAAWEAFSCDVFAGFAFDDARWGGNAEAEKIYELREAESQVAALEAAIAETALDAAFKKYKELAYTSGFVAQKEFENGTQMNTNESTFIELRGTGSFFRWNCDICGEVQEKDGMDSKVVFDTGRDTSQSFDICRECLEAGVEGAIERSLRQAEKLEERAQVLRKEIPFELRAVSEWKTGKDYDTVFNAFEQEMQKEFESEVI